MIERVEIESYMGKWISKKFVFPVIFQTENLQLDHEKLLEFQPEPCIPEIQV